MKVLTFSGRNLGFKEYVYEQSVAYLAGTAMHDAPPIEEIFAPFKYSLSSVLPNHVYNLCRIA